MKLPDPLLDKRGGCFFGLNFRLILDGCLRFTPTRIHRLDVYQGWATHMKATQTVGVWLNQFHEGFRLSWPRYSRTGPLDEVAYLATREDRPEIPATEPAVRSLVRDAVDRWLGFGDWRQTFTWKPRSGPVRGVGPSGLWAYLGTGLVAIICGAQAWRTCERCGKAYDPPKVPGRPPVTCPACQKAHPRFAAMKAEKHSRLMRG